MERIFTLWNSCHSLLHQQQHRGPRAKSNGCHDISNLVQSQDSLYNSLVQSCVTKTHQTRAVAFAAPIDIGGHFLQLRKFPSCRRRSKADVHHEIRNLPHHGLLLHLGLRRRIYRKNTEAAKAFFTFAEHNNVFVRSRMQQHCVRLFIRSATRNYLFGLHEADVLHRVNAGAQRFDHVGNFQVLEQPGEAVLHRLRHARDPDHLRRRSRSPRHSLVIDGLLFDRLRAGLVLQITEPFCAKQKE